MRVSEELQRRHSNTLDVLELFRERTGEWISANELAKVGGFCAWRSRVADARRIARKHDEDIIWNKHTRMSAYMLRPIALGRSSTSPDLAAEKHPAVPQTLFDLRPRP